MTTLNIIDYHGTSASVHCRVIPEIRGQCGIQLTKSDHSIKVWFPEKREEYSLGTQNEKFSWNRKQFVVPRNKRYIKFDWQHKEHKRLIEHKMLIVPWFSLYYNNKNALLSFTNYHYPELVVDKQNGNILVKYFQDAEKGYQGRSTTTKPGRYLTKFFPCLSSNQMDIFVSRAREYIPCMLSFARTPDEVVSTYINGPNSCMSKEADEFNSTVHPVSVYGNSDLSIAFVKRHRAIKARCVVWEKKKIYSRIYGDADLLVPLLEDAGFKSGKLYGARIRLIEQDHGVVMPYIDYLSGASADIKREYLILGSGKYETDTQTGVTPEECEEMIYCNYCEGEYAEDDYNISYFDTFGHVCDSCYNEHLVSCQGCDLVMDTESNDLIYCQADSLAWCMSCYEQRFLQCQECDDEVPVDDAEEGMCESCFSDKQEDEIEEEEDDPELENCPHCGGSDHSLKAYCKK